MDRIEFSVQDAPGPWPGMREYRLSCRHGVSSGAVLPGAQPLPDAIAIDLLLPAHHRSHACSCRPEATPVATLVRPPYAHVAPA